MKSRQIKPRFLRYRVTQGWGLIEDIDDTEVRSYADGSLRRFRYVHQIYARPERRLVTQRFPSEEEWTEFFELVSKLGVWEWDATLIQPICDFPSWDLWIKNGEKILRVGSGGVPPGFDEFDDAVKRLVHAGA